jgi:hypothetical protein
MKVVTIVVGTILAMWTAGIAIHGILTFIGFVNRPKTTWFSTQGVTEAAAMLAATGLGLTFTVWTFQSAFRKKAPDVGVSDH